MPQEIICVAASQRSGTNALRDMLSRTKIIRNCGEIFHPSAKQTLLFADFVREERIELGELMAPERAHAVMQRFLLWLREKAAGRHVLIDIKHNSWKAIPDNWRYAFDEPSFLKVLKNHRAIFVFLTRENLAEQVLSDFIAGKLNIWHNLDPEKVAGRTFEAPLKLLCMRAKKICDAEAFVWQFLESYPRKIVTTYEELFKNGELSGRFRSDFKKLAGVDLEPRFVGNIHINTADKRKIVVNYDEAAGAIGKISDQLRKRT